VSPARNGSWTIDQAERYLRSLELFGMRFGLERMRRLMTALDSPLEGLSAIQVVGTNGKSSTTRMIAAILRRHGVRTGSYLSPHLGSFSERIEIEERPVSEQRFAAAIRRATQAAELVDRGLPDGERVTQFELLTAAAYWELGRSDLELAVVEAGLGGRYDATSVIHPAVLVLTNVRLEHTRWLGPSERHIAEEKLAVVPVGGTVVTGLLGADALAIAEATARERHAVHLRAGRDFTLEQGSARDFAVRTRRRRYDRIALRPLGRFQRENFALALTAAEEWLRLSSGQALDPGTVRAAARELVVRGRLEVVANDPLVIFDGAHNPAGAAALSDSLGEAVENRRLIAVISILDDKDAAGMLSSLLPLCDGAVFTRSSHERALPPATLESLARQLLGFEGELVAEPLAALERARGLAGADGAVVVTGSIHLLSDLVRAARSGALDVSTSAR
jgi:dihydrofolate synthase/folylpolyglutamate synthase